MTKAIKLSASEKRKLYAEREFFVYDLLEQIRRSDVVARKATLVLLFSQQMGAWVNAIRCGNAKRASSLFPQLFKTATELQQAITNGEVVLISKEVADA